MSRCSRYGAATRIADSANGSSSEQPEEQAPVEPAEEQDAERDGDDHDECAEVGLEQQQGADRDHHREQRQETAEQRLLQRLLGMQERRLAHRIARRVEHDGELHELGGLQVDDAERQPAPRAVDRLADAGDEHQRQQHRAADEQPRRERAATPSSAPGTRRTRATMPTATNSAWRARKYHGAKAGVRRSFGHRDRRRIDHHERRSRAAGASPTRATHRRRASLRGLRGSARSDRRLEHANGRSVPVMPRPYAWASSREMRAHEAAKRSPRST